MNLSRPIVLRLLALHLAAALSGCTTKYVTPGGPAAIGAMTTPSIADALLTQPEAPLPATLAYTRVQAAGYYSYSTSGVNRGGLSIVGPHDLEKVTDAEAVAAWPQVRRLVRLTPVLVPARGADRGAGRGEDPLLSLREGAASLHADVLVLYTVDTDFRVDALDLGPLAIATLGVLPTHSAVVESTISMAFFDVRTGYCYGTAEGSARDDQAANVWTSGQAIDDCRRRVERTAFDALLAEAGKAWTTIAQTRAAQLARAGNAPVP